MRIHRDILSNTTLKSINSSKYNYVKRTVPPNDISKKYEIRQDGWRRKKNEEK